MQAVCLPECNAAYQKVGGPQLRFKLSFRLLRVYRTGGSRVYLRSIFVSGVCRLPASYMNFTHLNGYSLEAGNSALGLRESSEEGADVAAFSVRPMRVTWTSVLIDILDSWS